MPLELEDQLGPTGLQSLVSGGSKRCYLFNWDDVETDSQPENLTPSATDAESLSLISTPIVFKTGKKMYEQYATENTQKLKTTVVGGKDSYGLKIEGEFFLPGLSAKALGIGVMGTYAKMGWLYELNTGQRILVGSKRWPARLNFEFDGGEPEAGGLGITYKVAAFGTTVAVYEPEPQLVPEA